MTPTAGMQKPETESVLILLRQLLLKMGINSNHPHYMDVADDLICEFVFLGGIDKCQFLKTGLASDSGALPQ